MAEKIIADNAWSEACDVEVKLTAMAHGMEMIREACQFEYTDPKQGEGAQERILFLAHAVEDLLEKVQERQSAITTYLQAL